MSPLYLAPPAAAGPATVVIPLLLALGPLWHPVDNMAQKSVINLSLDISIISAISEQSERSGISRSEVANEILSSLLTKRGR